MIKLDKISEILIFSPAAGPNITTFYVKAGLVAFIIYFELRNAKNQGLSLTAVHFLSQKTPPFIARLSTTVVRDSP